ncbi:competence protein ComJ [Mesorhizobium sp. CC13]|uniref:competence protein ComJ n=1 Tax=Mesorhizobium sp. CC13 TaxID=3029194 RepID=UPI00326374B3
MSTVIQLEVSYGQIAIFDPSLSQPFNDWTEQHVAQGFAWRPGSVSFRTVGDDGHYCIAIEVVDHAGPLEPETVRAIEVPFDVPPRGEIEVASIADTAPFSIEAGGFLLRCEFIRPGHPSGHQAKFTFSRKDKQRFAVMLADEALSINGPLLTTAKAAPS